MSATHVGFCALRLEPIWSSLGQAAGHAARWEKLARESGVATDRLPKADGRTTRGDWIRAAFAGDKR